MEPSCSPDPNLGSSTKALSDELLWYGTSGPRDAAIVVVGEAWGYEENLAKVPFVGSSGSELTRILADANIDRRNCLLTNVCASRPPNNDFWHYFDGNAELRGLYPSDRVVSELQRLYLQINSHPRSIIIAVGNYALWALSHCTGAGSIPGAPGYKAPNGIMSWRGSMIYTEEEILGARIPLLPIIHPAAIMRQWDLRYITVHDLRARVPMALSRKWDNPTPPTFFAPPTYAQCIARLDHWLRLLDNGPLRLSGDIETYKKTLITCIGFADSPFFAMSIPFVRKTPNDPDAILASYWSIEQEVQIVFRINQILLHPNIILEGQNFIYDSQYIYHWQGVVPYCDFDTMLAQHVFFPGTPKGLDYLSSLYCRYHRYWKDDGKEWNLEGTLEDLLKYNAEDCIRTFECATTQRDLMVRFGLEDQWNWMKRKRDLALRMMMRGVNINRELRDKIGFQLMEVHRELAEDLFKIIPQAWAGEPGKKAKTKEPVFWFASSKQLKWVFGEMLGIKIPKHRKTKTDTLGKEALNELREVYPVWRPLFNLLADLRSVGVFISHFIRAPLDPDNRMRCSFNPGGTETFRWSSSKNAFGRGANLQNLPKGDED